MYDCGPLAGRVGKWAERERERAWRVAPAGLLFDKEATTLFYNCVFNLMDSLMRFVVYSSVRGRATDGEKKRGTRETGRREGRGRVWKCWHTCTVGAKGREAKGSEGKGREGKRRERKWKREEGKGTDRTIEAKQKKRGTRRRPREFFSGPARSPLFL